MQTHQRPSRRPSPHPQPSALGHRAVAFTPSICSFASQTLPTPHPPHIRSQLTSSLGITPSSTALHTAGNTALA